MGFIEARVAAVVVERGKRVSLQFPEAKLDSAAECV